ncbi:glutaredoxin 3 [Sphingobium sp. CAP-1]|uniref:glutaredoxin 3 n=1 Tax=Sphingobium sp. CAP-1 TaxID=2676077 RepID=UPI0012BB29E3|nr:glutaredoxin 3 [Sphingobium sp. CAP-1]QGP80932.1 glutaredoxin 3 [Sphingobium sp. CAP-1]
MAKVEIYTKDWCGYCARAKALLADKGVAYEEYDISLGGPKREEMLERAPGRTSVPQIFIDGAHIGGSDDLSALNRAGKLDALLGL